MLKTFRAAAKSKFAIPVIILLVLSFAVWGVNDAFRGRPADAVATVGPEKVTMTELARTLRNEIASRADGGRQMSIAEARATGLDQQVLSQLITISALDAKAGRLGLEASDTALTRAIRDTEAFQDTVRGEFSRDVYESALAGVGIGQKEYEDSLRDDLTRQQLLDVIYSPVQAPASFQRTREAWRNEQRTAEVLVLPAALASLDETPDDAALQQVIDENPAAFTWPELRGVTVTWLDMETMRSIVEVSDEDVRALFEFRGESLATPETRTFVQITAPDEETANAAAERLRAGDAPQAIAEDLGLAPPVAQASAVRRDIVDSAVAEAIFESMDPRVVVVNGALGWAAVEVTGGAPARAPDFEALEPQLRAELAEDGASDTLYDTIAELEDGLGAGLSLEDASAAAGVAAQSYEPVSAQGMSVRGDLYADLASNPSLLSAVFALPEGARTELIELQDGGYAMARVDSIVPSRVAELDEVRAEATELWRVRRLDASLQEVEDEARAQIEGGAAFSQVAARIGQPARTELAVLRRGQTSGPVDAALSGQLFAAAQGELVSGRTANGSRVLARVTRIEQTDGDNLTLGLELSNEITNDLLMQFQNALSEEYRVRVYEDQVALALGETPDQ